MNKEPLLILTGIGLVGSIVFHGHPAGKDCWLCSYKGWVFLGSSVILGTWLAFQDS